MKNSMTAIRTFWAHLFQLWNLRHLNQFRGNCTGRVRKTAVEVMVWRRISVLIQRGARNASVLIFFFAKKPAIRYDSNPRSVAPWNHLLLLRRKFLARCNVTPLLSPAGLKFRQFPDKKVFCIEKTYKSTKKRRCWDTWWSWNSQSSIANVRQSIPYCI